MPEIKYVGICRMVCTDIDSRYDEECRKGGDKIETHHIQYNFAFSGNRDDETHG